MHLDAGWIRASSGICLSVVHASNLPACGRGLSASGFLALTGNRYRIVSLPTLLVTSTFLPPFARRALPRVLAPMAALTPAGRPIVRPAPTGLPHSHAPPLPDLLSPTTAAGSPHASVFTRGGCGGRPPQTSPFARRLVAAATAESCSLVIAVDLVLSVAPHPASRRRSYFEFSPAQRLPAAGVSHPGRGRCSAAHERGLVIRPLDGATVGACGFNPQAQRYTSCSSVGEDRPSARPSRLRLRSGSAPLAD